MYISIQNLFWGQPLQGFLMAVVISGAKTIIPAEMKEVLSTFDIFPGQLSDVPNYPITVEYPEGSVNFGTNFTEMQVYEQPSKLSWPVEKKMKEGQKLFTMMLYGPDVPTRENPISDYQWIHWIIINIPGSRWREGQVVIEYRAWQPFYTDDIHRCIFLVHPQKAREPIVYNDTIIKTESSDELRGFFNKDIFARKYNLEAPYAINFFQMHLNGSEEDGNIWM